MTTSPKWGGMRDMTFNEYMRGRCEAEIAKLIGGCTEHAVRKWRYGERRPDADTMLRIEVITEGQVTLRDWVKLPPDAKPSQKVA